MALTLELVEHTSEGSKRGAFWNVTFDASYPTGGESLTAADLALNVLRCLHVCDQGSGGYIYSYDRANEKFMVRRTGAINSALAELPNGTTLAHVTIRIQAIGH